MKVKRQRRRVGDVVRIDLPDGFHCYARVLPEALFAFYDFHEGDEATVENVASRPVLFVIAVMRHAITRGRWTVVGHAALEKRLRDAPPRFVQDPIRKDQFRLYKDGRLGPASRDQCLGLEREAVWDPEHVEDRLRDHYAGRVNKWVESLRPQP